MSQIETDILFNGIGLEVHPSGLSKCGEIQIDDCCTNAYIFCAFCPAEEDHGDPKLYRTLQEFIDHIRWHRSDSLETPILSNDISYIGFEGPEDDAQSDFSAAAAIHEVDYVNDWIAPPEELFELNKINNFIEPESQPDGSASKGVRQEVETPKSAPISYIEPYGEKIENNPTLADPSQEDEDIPELTGEVFIELLNLFKKCPCLWHHEIAATTNSKIINAVYKLLADHFNKITQQSKSVDYVRRVVMQIKNCFLEEYKDPKQSKDSLPWYFHFLSFLLHCDSKELDKSIFTDFTCPICTKELTSQEELWTHLLQVHLETAKDNKSGLDSDDMDIPNDKTPVTEYPEEVVDKFIDLCRSQTCLWDKRSKGYFSPPLRRKSYNKLLNILREYDPNATQAEVVHRTNYLRSQFANGEKRRKIIPLENSKPINSQQLKFPITNTKMKNKKHRKPLPQLKVRPGNLKKKIKSGKCPICSRSFNNHLTWLNHIESAHSSEDYQSEDGFIYCTICGWQNKTKSLLMRHLRNRHTYDLHRCTECGSQFRLLSILVEHRKKAHNDFNPFKCETCGEGFTTRPRLRTHSSTHLATIDENGTERCTTESVDENGTEQCTTESVDGKSCGHMPDKKEDNTHICDKCCMKFQSSQMLSAHENEIHVETNNASHINNDAPKPRKSASDHKNRNSCDACGAKFFRKPSLRKHKRLKQCKTNSAS